MNELQKTAALLRHPDKEQRRLAIQQLSQSLDPNAVLYLDWAVKNEKDPELQKLALEAVKRLRLIVDAPPVVAKQNISKASLDAKEKRVQSTAPVARYDWVDSLIGLAFMTALICSWSIGNWLDLSGVQLQSGGTYGEYMEEQREALRDRAGGRAPYAEFIDKMNLAFDSTEIGNLVNPNFDYTVADIIYYHEPLARADLIRLGYEIPNTSLNLGNNLSWNIIMARMIVYFLLMLIGGGLLVIHINYGGFLGLIRYIVGFMAPRITYWSALALVITNFALLWLWYALYANKLVAAILDNQNIAAQPYNLVAVTSFQFWVYNAYLVVLMGLCLYGITRHSREAVETE